MEEIQKDLNNLFKSVLECKTANLFDKHLSIIFIKKNFSFEKIKTNSCANTINQIVVCCLLLPATRQMQCWHDSVDIVLGA